MMAGAIPKSLKTLKKAMITVAMATIPNSSGAIKRASIPATTKDIMIPEYLEIAVYNTPERSSFFVSDINIISLFQESKFCCFSCLSVIQCFFD